MWLTVDLRRFFKGPPLSDLFFRMSDHGPGAVARAKGMWPFRVLPVSVPNTNSVPFFWPLQPIEILFELDMRNPAEWPSVLDVNGWLLSLPDADRIPWYRL